MKKIGIIVNSRKDPDYIYFKKLCDVLISSGFMPVISCEIKMSFEEGKYVKTTIEEIFKISSLVITLGGDGTLLNIADLAVRYDVAILGVNLGTLGYLAQIDKTDIDRIPEILNSNYNIQNRMMLSATVYRNNKCVYNYSALNDAVITRSAVLKPVYIDLLGDNGVIADYFCDGLIFSTPTGSSAYSLSVGGPVMDPSMEAILVSAISPHSLSGHSLVFNANKALGCRVKSPKAINALISVDGRHVFYIQQDDRIEIKKNEKYLKLVKLTDTDFYTVLKRKFSLRSHK